MPCKKSLDPLTEESGSDEQDEGGEGGEEEGTNDAGSKLVCRYLPSRGNSVVVNGTARCSTSKLARKGSTFFPATRPTRSAFDGYLASPLPSRVPDRKTFQSLAATSAILTLIGSLCLALFVSHVPDALLKEWRARQCRRPAAWPL